MSFPKYDPKNRFSNKRTELDGRSFQSKFEASVYAMLKILQMAKEIKIEQCQDHVYLTDAEICYIPDFKCRNLKTGELYWVEAKGFETPEWKLKLRLWRYYGPGPLHIYKGTHRCPVLTSIVIPRERKLSE